MFAYNCVENWMLVQPKSNPYTVLFFSRRFRRKSRLLQWLVFFRQFNAIGPLFVHYALLPYVTTSSHHCRRNHKS